MFAILQGIFFLVVCLFVGIVIALLAYGAGLILSMIIGVTPIIGTAMFFGSLVLAILVFVVMGLSDVFAFTSMVKAHHKDDDHDSIFITAPNEKCHCGSLKRYKNCCMRNDRKMNK